MLTMHSFDRVVRRHEQEAILQHPSTWDPMYRAELEASRALRQDRARRVVSTVPPAPRRLGWSDVPSVRVRSTMSVMVPSEGLSPRVQRSSPASRVGSVPSEEHSPASGMEHMTNEYHSSNASPQASPTYDGQCSPSLWTASLSSPCSSEVHIIRHTPVQSGSTEKGGWS